MLKRFIVFSFLFFIFSFFFLSSVSAVQIATPTPTPVMPHVSSGPQLLVSFKKGQSPEDLQNQLAKEIASSRTLGGIINNQIAKLFGKQTQLDKLKSQISFMQLAEKKANVQSVKKIKTIESISPNVYMFTLSSGADVSASIAELKKLPEVESVIPNFILKMQTRKGSSIQSVEEVPSTVQYIVQYKKDLAPQQIQAKVESRTGMIGQVARIAEDMGTNDPTPEDRLHQIQTTWNKLDYVYSANVYPSSAQSNSLLQNTQVVTFENTASTQEVINTYKNLPEVAAIIPNFVVHTTATPNDPYFSQLWGMSKIQAPTAWDKNTGSNSITVAVIDSGVDYNHPDLAENVIKGTDFSTCNDTAQDQESAQPGTCLHPKQPDSDPMDDLGHGTHVAGTIGAVGNNSIGVSGINWHVKILAIKAMGSGGAGMTTDVLQGINYAVTHGAKVINMSLGGSIAPYSCKSSDSELQVIRSALDNAKNAGVTIVVAAGNDNENASYDLYASCPEVIAVGATTQSDTRASFSNYGSDVVIAAPGFAILSTVSSIISPELIASCGTLPQSSQYRFCSGTSMATPHIAGAAGLLLSINPGLTPDQIKDYLVRSGDIIATDRPIGPRLNLAKAVDLVSGPGNPTATPTGTVSPSPTGSGIPTPTGTGGSPTPTGTQPTEGNGALKITVTIPGIGDADNPSPQQQTKMVLVELLNQDGDSVASTIGNLSYNNGVYSGEISTESIPSGTYQIRVHVVNTLKKIIPGFYTLSNSTILINTPAVTVIPGDLNGDNILDLLDYNTLILCIQLGCDGDIFLESTDINSDGVIDAKDLNIFLRQLETRTGD